MGFIPVGKVVADHGLGGAVKFKYYNEDAENFYRYSSLITNKNERQAELKLTEVRFSKGFFYLKFEGLNSPEQVSFLINQELFVREEDLPPLENDEYYDYQLIGLHVVNHSGELIGTVSQVIHTGVNDIIVVKGKEEILVPMVEGLVSKIDLKNSLITIDEEALLV
ncbi:MAG: rimM [Deltaproteobacteria bacterium]|jgi:16S rRNA processing protein RimM|nr:rimM [Deltaproteobacteria bacterium]